MDVRNFMPECEKKNSKNKTNSKSNSRRKLIIEDENGCKVVEAGPASANANANDFDVVIDALVKESKPHINKSLGVDKNKKKGKGKQNAKEQLRQDKLMRAAQDIYDKYKRKGCGKNDNKVDSAQWIKRNLFDNCRIKPNTLYRIMKHYMVVKNNPLALESLRFSYIIEKPFNFLNDTFQFLSFKKCEFIMEVYKLREKTPKPVIANGYIFDKFMAENTYYLPQYKYVHQSQAKKITEIKNLTKTNSPMFPYKYDVLENDFYETMRKYGIISKSSGPDSYSEELCFGKSKLLSLENVTNAKRNTFWTTEKFTSLEKHYGTLLRQHFGDEQKTECPYKKNAIKDWIKKVETQVGITLNEQQIKAVNTALRYKLMCISGYPGTGKSTIVDFIVRFRREVMEKPTCLMAPTGKAVKSLMNKLSDGKTATQFKGASPLIATCHKFVYTIFNDYIKAQEDPNADLKDSLIKSYMDAKKNPFDCVIIDESSMMDFNIFMAIIDFVTEYGGTIIFVGDINQLPPVSAGRPYECIYKSGLFKCVELQQIMRSSGNISKFVLGLNGNRYDELDQLFDGKEVKYYETAKFSEAYFKSFFRKIIEDTENGLTGFKRNYSVISAQNGGEDGQGTDWDGSVNQLNQVLQEICLEIRRKETRTEDGDYEEVLSVRTNRRAYYDGDRVIRMVNDYSSKTIRVNGEMGTLMMRKRIEDNGKEKIVITVNYDDGDIQENMDVLDLEDNFNLAYASTVHKMQGSENKNIIVVMSNQHYMWKGEGCKKLLYTAVSRAKEQLTILTQIGAFTESLKFCGKPEKSFHSEFLSRGGALP